jgi:hypothetical protein
MKEALRSSETSVLTRATWRNIPEDTVLLSGVDGLSRDTFLLRDLTRKVPLCPYRGLCELTLGQCQLLETTVVLYAVLYYIIYASYMFNVQNKLRGP